MTTSPPAVCSLVKSRPRRVKRSLSQRSLDVKGSVVLEKVWMFEGIGQQILSGSEEQLSETDTGQDDWCNKHTWFLSTNLLSSQLCAKCTKRILPKRAAYKCTACKRLCHLKCAIQDSQTKTPTTVTHPIPSTSAAIKHGAVEAVKRTRVNKMNMEDFVTQDDYATSQSCKYSKKTSSKRRRGPFQRLELNNNQTEMTEYNVDDIPEYPYSVDTMPQTSEAVCRKTGGQNTSGQSQAKHRLTNMKHSFVKRCRSIKKKVKNLKEKNNANNTVDDQKQSSDDQQENSLATTSSSGDQADRAAQDREAWVRSPVRTRLRARQLELRREAVKMTARKNGETAGKSGTLSSNLKSGRRHRYHAYDLDDIHDRLEIVEKRVCALETAIPVDVHEWQKLKQKFQDGTADYAQMEARIEKQIIQETHPKQLEAENNVPYGSSGTSDEVYLIPEHPSTSSQEEAGHVIPDHGHVTYSPVTSLNDDSLPSGIPNRMKLNVENDAYMDHQTSTPVTAKEISFRSASRNYEKTHKILHTNVTTINVDHSYSENTPVGTEPVKGEIDPPPNYADVIQNRYESEYKSLQARYTGLDTVDAKTVTFQNDNLGCPSDFRNEGKLGNELNREEYETSPLNYGRFSDHGEDKIKEKVLSPEQEAVKSFLSSRKRSLGTSRVGNISMIGSQGNFNQASCGSRSPCRSSARYRTRSPSPTHRSSEQYCSPRRQAGQGSNQGSPSSRHEQRSFTGSPPIASSTFREGNGIQSDMSPVSFTLRNDIGDNTQSSFTKIAEESKLEEARTSGGDRQGSSNSNLSYTFRNDSQMVPTNAEEDLPGYTKNRSFHRSEVYEHVEDVHPFLHQEYNRAEVFTHVDNRDSSTDDDGEPGGTQMMVEAEIEPEIRRESMEVPRECVRFTMCETSPTTVTTTTDDALSLTNVTEVTGDYIDSFAETAEHVSKSRWVNKDVFQFARDRVKPPARTKCTLSHEKIDETGDGRKPPLPAKRYSSSSDIDYLKEANRRLEEYKGRRSGSFDKIEAVTAGVCLESLPRQSDLNKYGTDDIGSPVEVKEHFIETFVQPQTAEKLLSSSKKSYLDLGHNGEFQLESQTQSHSYSRAEDLPPRGSSNSCLNRSPKHKRSPSPKRSPSSKPRSPSAKPRSPSSKSRSPSSKSRSPSSKPRSPSSKPRSPSSKSRSPSSKSRSPSSKPRSPSSKPRSPSSKTRSSRRSPSPVKRNRSPKPRSPCSNRGHSPKHSPLVSRKQTSTKPASSTKDPSPKHVNSTREFEDLERHLHEESLARRNRLSRSLTNLPQCQPDPLNGLYQRQKSFSCTNSVDGETKSIINESAKYHFLHDKGMIKISSPCLKIMNGSPATRHRETRRYNDIDEESDVLESGSGSELSGVYVDNKFKINSFLNTPMSSATGSSQGKNGEACSNVTETNYDFHNPRVGQRNDDHMEIQQKRENEYLEQYLQTVDAAHGSWDENVLRWINDRYHGEDLPDNAELEHELGLLLQEEQASSGDNTLRKEVNRTNGSQPNTDSPIDESFYYSFQGQSEDLRSALSPLRRTPVPNIVDNGSQTRLSSGEMGPGLMFVIQNGNVQDVADLLNSDRTVSEGEIKEAVFWALEEKNFDIAILLLNDVCKLIHAAEGESCIDVFPAYLIDNRWDPVFVILTKHDFQGEWDTFMGFHVYRRQYKRVSSEAATVINSDFVRTHPLSVDEFKVVRRAISSAELQKEHSKITVINACPCKSKQGGRMLEEGLCIVVHCLIKGFIPFDEEPFPTEVGGIPVDVREGYFRLGVAKTRGQADIRQQMWDLGMFSGDDCASTRSSRASNRSRSGRSHETESLRSEGSRSGRSQFSTKSGLQSGSVTGDNVLSGSSVIKSSESEHDEDKLSASISSRKSINSVNSGSKSSEMEINSVSPEGHIGSHGDVKVMNGDLDLDADSCRMDSAEDNMPNKLMSDEMLDKVTEGNRSCDWNQQLLMGTSVGLVGGASRGTLGGFVLLEGGEVGFVTCGHVLTSEMNTDSTVGSMICQPASNGTPNTSRRFTCGSVVKVIYKPGSADQPGVDLGVVRVTARIPVEAGFIHVTDKQLKDAGFQRGKEATFGEGKVFNMSDLNTAVLYTPVIKYGSQSGLTTGKLYSDGLYACQSKYLCTGTQDRPVKPMMFFNQMEISAVPGSSTRFFLPGDSGALVFTCTSDSSLQCMGMAIGYTSYGSCVVTPIHEIMNALKSVGNFIDFTKC